MLEIVLAFSHHMLPGDWNEVHPGLRYESGVFMGAVYHNSEDDVSLAAGFIGRRGNLFAEVGAAPGYDGGTVVPFLRVGVDMDRVRFFVAPAANTDGDIGAVIGVETILMRF